MIANKAVSRAEINPNRWDKAKRQRVFEIRYRYPVGDQVTKLSSSSLQGLLWH